MDRRTFVRTALGTTIGATMGASLGTTLAGTASASHSVVEVPYRMDASNQAGWWRPIEEHNGHVYLAYNAWGGPGPTNGGPTDTHTVYIARRSPDGSWTRGCLKSAPGSGCVVYGDDVGHNQPSIAIDGDGYIHAFVSMHNDNWRYYRSDAPGDVTTMVNRSAELPDQGLRYTYPNLAKAQNGDVYLIIRVYPTWPGPGYGRLFRWSNSAKTWARVATFAADSDWIVYPNDVAGTSDGRIHIGWEWAYGGANGLRHLGSYLVYDPATGQFRNAAGTVVNAPATTASPVVYRPLGPHENPPGCRKPSSCPGVQSAKLAINPSTGRPLVAYRYRSNHNYPFRVWLAEWTGSSWANSLVYAGNYDTYAALDITTPGSDDVRVYYAKKETLQPNQPHVATRSQSGGWVEHALLYGARVERLSVIRRSQIDYLYMADPGDRKLYFGQMSW